MPQNNKQGQYSLLQEGDGELKIFKKGGDWPTKVGRNVDINTRFNIGLFSSQCTNIRGLSASCFSMMLSSYST